MQNLSCSYCNKPKSTLQCGLCTCALCKNCALFLEKDSFSFLPEIPVELSHSTYCPQCFAEKVTGPLENYQAKMELAKNVFVFSKSQSKETRLIKRSEKLVYVTDCTDHDEAILRLAFFAALKDCNAIIDVDLTSKKVRNGSYQTTLWSGSGIPANVSQDRLVKDRSIWQNPN